jgi:hypothetical protein
LTIAAETIIAMDSGALLCRHIAELEIDKDTLQCAVDQSIEDCNLVVVGNKNLLSEHYELKHHCEDL